MISEWKLSGRSESCGRDRFRARVGEEYKMRSCPCDHWKKSGLKLTKAFNEGFNSKLVEEGTNT